MRVRLGWIGLAITCFVLAGLWFWFDSASVCCLKREVNRGKSRGLLWEDG